MIVSGSHVPGIDPDSFGLPAGTAIRFERPAEPLQHLIPAYAVMDSDITVFKGTGSWMLPGWAQIWIILAEAPIASKIRNRRYAPLGQAILYGPTSQAIDISAQGGVSVAIEISPLAWARFFDVSAEDCRDRITPLAELWPAAWVDDLIARLHASDRALDVKGILDDFLLSHLPPPNPIEQRVEAAMRALADPTLNESSEVAERVGLSAQTLLRLCRRYFGYGPKQLMRRARFLNALIELMLGDGLPDFSHPPTGYHDVPHFIRDGKGFLGMTPRRFLAIHTPYLYAAMRARRLITGVPWALLEPLRAWRTAQSEGA